MRPLRLLPWSAVAFAAALAQNIGGAAAIEPPAKSATPAAAVYNAPAPQNMPHSIPEDGMGDIGVPASSRLVRQLLAAHPNQDMVICIAGCRPGVDRVVYAVPSDPLPPAIAVTQPVAAEPAATGEAEPQKATEPVAAAPAAAAAANNAVETKPAAEAPAPAAKAEPTEQDTKKMVPTAAGKNDEPANADNKSDDSSDDTPPEKNSSESSDDDSSSNDDSDSKD